MTVYNGFLSIMITFLYYYFFLNHNDNTGAPSYVNPCTFPWSNQSRFLRLMFPSRTALVRSSAVRPLLHLHILLFTIYCLTQIMHRLI